MKHSAMIQALSAVKKRKRPNRKTPREIVHERLAQGLVMGAQVEPVEIQCPNIESDKIIAFRSYRDDPLAKLKRDGHIDEIELKAGRYWQADYEAAQGTGGIRGMTYQDPVDGSGPTPDPISDRQQKAVKKLAECDRALGELGSQIIRLYLGYGMFAGEIAKRLGSGKRSEADYFGRRIRECLNTLLVVYQLKGPNSPA